MSQSPADQSSNASLPIALGIAGLVPFALCSATIAAQMSLPLIGNSESARDALIVYAVAILSFTGGIRWGIALKDNNDRSGRDLIISVIPALAGWFAYFLEAPRDLWMLCVAFVIFGLLDYGLSCRTVVPEWFGKLRIALSAGAALCLAVAAIAG
jgi:hypothetical protein